MGIKFGEIDANQILDNEFRIKTLERIVQWIINNNPRMTQPKQSDLDGIRREVLTELQSKYPKSDLKFES